MSPMYFNGMRGGGGGPTGACAACAASAASCCCRITAAGCCGGSGFGRKRNGFLVPSFGSGRSASSGLRSTSVIGFFHPPCGLFADVAAGAFAPSVGVPRCRLHAAIASRRIAAPASASSRRRLGFIASCLVVRGQVERQRQWPAALLTLSQRNAVDDDEVATRLDLI